MGVFEDRRCLPHLPQARTRPRVEESDVDELFAIVGQRWAKFWLVPHDVVPLVQQHVCRIASCGQASLPYSGAVGWTRLLAVAQMQQQRSKKRQRHPSHAPLDVAGGGVTRFYGGSPERPRAATRSTTRKSYEYRETPALDVTSIREALELASPH